MIQAFISYAHEDQEMCREMHKQLIPFERMKQINFWHDRRIDAGDGWRDEILKALNAAQVALFLVSPDMFASDFIWKEELPCACRRLAAGELTIIPVILRPCTWTFKHQRYCLPKLQAVPKDAVPISKHENRDDAYHDAAKRIMAKVAKRFRIKGASDA
jgi:hypothetical protein